MTYITELYGETCQIKRINDAIHIHIPDLSCIVKITATVEIYIDESEISIEKFQRIKKISKKIQSNMIIIKNMFDDL